MRKVQKLCDPFPLEGAEVENSAGGEYEGESPMEEDGLAQLEEDDDVEEEDEVQFAMGDYAVVQGAFATGFSSPGRTWPGHTVRLALRSTWICVMCRVLFCQVRPCGGGV